jgi:hypothetical protein
MPEAKFNATEYRDFLKMKCREVAQWSERRKLAADAAFAPKLSDEECRRFIEHSRL